MCVCVWGGEGEKCISPKLPSYWRLMNKFVRGYQSSLRAGSPLSGAWFMDTQQCMSYNFKGVCFSSRRWNFKCCDEWPLVAFYLLLCRGSARTRARVRSYASAAFGNFCRACNLSDCLQKPPTRHLTSRNTSPSGCHVSRQIKWVSHIGCRCENHALPVSLSSCVYAD